MKTLDGGYIRLDKHCERCARVVRMVIPNNTIFWWFKMFPNWRCLWCGNVQEAMTHELELLSTALIRTRHVLLDAGRTATPKLETT